jgi:poly-gamma-glutamate synthesis protein (capsule biosynthesis protein)
VRKLFLGGDTMTGRGIDQVLPHPGDPCLHEASVASAATYVELAESAHGPIPSPVDFRYVWGDALDELVDRRPDVRIVNLETAVTRHGAYWAGKAVHYRMHPDNVSCLTVAGIDCCVLANNHVLDYGHAGLLETLDTLREAGIRTAGAGRTLAEAWTPAVIDCADGGRVLVFGFGSGTSGIEASWAAGAGRPGVNLLSDLSNRTLDRIRDAVECAKQPGDVVVASIHWGSNWGFGVPASHIRFAHGLIEAGVDVVHGHSSHHVRPIELYREKLILYGCGGLLDDYEGIPGYEEFRPDLVTMFFATVDPRSGRLCRLHMAPMRIRNFRLRRASPADVHWLADTIDRESRAVGARIELVENGRLALEWS